MDDFGKRVYGIVGKIPPGKVATYGQVARLAGKESGARAVGKLMRGNPNIGIIPCHRVVGAGGLLVGYVNGIQEKKRKLVAEGVVFRGIRVNLQESMIEDGKLQIR